MSCLKLLLAIAALLVAATGASAPMLVIGAISGKPTEEVAKFHPLAEHLARRLGEFGIRQGKVVVVGSVRELAELMKGGGADLMVDSPYPTLAVSQLSGSKVLLRRWKGGKPSYRSLVLVRADSPVASVKDLRGRVIAFEDGYSTSGYFLPAATLQRAGLTLRELPHPRASLKTGEIGYVFSDSYANSLTWLLHRRTDAIGVGEHDYERFLKRETDQMRIVLETPHVPRNLVSVRGDLAPTLVARIHDLLVELEHTQEGKVLLESLDRTTRFDALPAEAEQALESIRRLLRQSGSATAR
jgi:phosphate/phosphite/phosphonate ABC transporter binding protein